MKADANTSQEPEAAFWSTIPLNMSRGDILTAIDTLCGRLADTGVVEECWAIRRAMDEQYPEEGERA